jgi:hypothetical protein
LGREEKEDEGWECFKRMISGLFKKKGIMRGKPFINCKQFFSFFLSFFLNCYTIPVITDQPHASSEHELRPLGPKADPQPTFLLI